MGLADTLLSRPQLFRPDLAITDTSVDAAAQRLALSLNLREFARRPCDDPFLYRASTVAVGDLVVSTGLHGPMHVVTEETARATVIFALGGETSFSYEGGELHFGAMHDLVYMPGCAFVEDSNWISGVLFSVDVDRLVSTTMSMAGFQGKLRRIRQRLQTPQLIRPQPGSRAMEVVMQLRTLFTLLDAPQLDRDQLLERLGIDDLLYRAMAMAFCADLIQAPEPNTRPVLGSRAAIIDDLITWITANLDRPIRLSDLEQQSSYSQRTLRKAFQERFGCGPHQWIHEQRMEAARQQLLNPAPEDSVSSVARRWGYTHLSQFSRDFQRAFGIPPSGALREGRQSRL